jgi:hypothetical protein
MVSVYLDEGQEPPATVEQREPLRADCLDLLEPEQRELVADVVGALTVIVAAARERSASPGLPPSLLVGALGGAELVISAELLTGNANRIPSLLPSFAYLASLPFLGQREAIRRSERVREVLAS